MTDDTTRLEPAIPGFILGFPALVAVVFLSFGIPLAWQSHDFVAASDSVDGTITALREVRSCSTKLGQVSSRVECSRVWFPTVRFTTLTGQALEHETMSSLSTDAFEVGDEVAVRYRRVEPSLAQIDDLAVLWGIPAGLIAVGGLAAIAYITLRRISWRRARPRPPGKRAHQPVPWWVTAVSLLIPAGLAWMTAFLASDALEFWRASRVAPGEVITIGTDNDHKPVFRYEDHLGVRHEGEPQTAPFETFNVVGRTVDIRHRLDDPAVFRAAATEYSIWKPALMLGFWAGLFGFVLVGALRFMAT